MVADGEFGFEHSKSVLHDGQQMANVVVVRGKEVLI